MILNEEMKDMNERQYKGFANHYAAEFLKSSGEPTPSPQKATYGKALLIETDPILAKIHYILLSNYGFSVDLADTLEKVFEKENVAYSAIFSRINQKNINGWMAAHFFQCTSKTRKPKIFLFMNNEDNKHFHEHFLRRGVEAVFEVPLNVAQLRDEIRI
jgi:CheY-like chemotaxis protein